MIEFTLKFRQTPLTVEFVLRSWALPFDSFGTRKLRAVRGTFSEMPGSIPQSEHQPGLV